MRTDGFDNITEGLAKGNGVILALPHLGGWEWAGRWLVDLGHGRDGGGRAARPAGAVRLVRRPAGQAGHEGGARSGPSAGREVIAALRRNDIVCLLCDRDIQRNGVEVEFFGETTTLPAGPVTVAMRTGAPILPTAVYFTDRSTGHLGLVRPPLPLVRTDEGLHADVREARKRWRTSWSTSCDGRRSNGTCSSRTGRATPATDLTWRAVDIAMSVEGGDRARRRRLARADRAGPADRHRSSR